MTISGSLTKNYLNISSQVLFDFFKKPVQALVKCVQLLVLREAKYVQPKRRRVQDFRKKLNMSKGEPVQLFPRKAEHVKAGYVQVVFTDSAKTGCRVTTWLD